MTTARKSMLNLSVSIGGIVVAQGGGENDFISITSPAQFGSKTGVHGDVVFFDTPANVYEITLNLLETADLNEALQNMLASQKASPVAGPTTMAIVDIGTGERLSGQAMIVKDPDRSKGAEAGNYEWQIHLASPEGVQYQAPVPIIP